MGPKVFAIKLNSRIAIMNGSHLFKGIFFKFGSGVGDVREPGMDESRTALGGRAPGLEATAERALCCERGGGITLAFSTSGCLLSRRAKPSSISTICCCRLVNLGAVASSVGVATPSPFDFFSFLVFFSFLLLFTGLMLCLLAWLSPQVVLTVGSCGYASLMCEHNVSFRLLASSAIFIHRKP